MKQASVILITIDALRCDAVSCYGRAPVRTPTIDRIAADGVLFANHYSAATSTHMGHFSLFTGLPAQEFEIESLDKVFFDAQRFLALPQLFARHGYQCLTTADEAFSKGPRPFRHEAIFDPCQRLPHQHFLQQGAAGRALWGLSLFDMPLVCRWVEEQTGPYFLHYYAMDTHASVRNRQRRRALQPGSERDFVAARVCRDDRTHTYYDRVAFVDGQLQQLLAMIDDRREYDDALIIVTTDHGEGLGERWHFDHGRPGQLQQEFVHTPLVIKPPRYRGPRRVEALASAIDVYPTIVDLLELEHDIDGYVRPLGRSLLPLLAPAGQDAAHRDLVTIETRWPKQYDRSVAIVDSHGWKLIYGRTGIRGLYDLNTDPAEKRNLYDDRHDFSQRARQLVRAALRRQRENRRLPILFVFDLLRALARSAAPRRISSAHPAKTREFMSYMREIEPAC